MNAAMRSAQLKGRMSSNIQIRREQLARRKSGAWSKRRLPRGRQGSTLNSEELTRKGRNALYLLATEALGHKLISDII